MEVYSTFWVPSSSRPPHSIKILPLILNFPIALFQLTLMQPRPPPSIWQFGTRENIKIVLPLCVVHPAGGRKEGLSGFSLLYERTDRTANETKHRTPKRRPTRRVLGCDGRERVVASRSSDMAGRGQEDEQESKQGAD